MALIGQKSPLLNEGEKTNENKSEINGNEGNRKELDKGDFESETVQNDYQKWLKHTTCSLTIVWLVCIVLHMFSIGLMCYGVRRQLWPLLIPHIIFRISWIIIILMLIASIISSLFNTSQNKDFLGQIILCIMLFIISLIISLFVKSEIFCIEFVKLSVETGFSISNTRPFAPPSTASQSGGGGGDGARPEHIRRVVHTSIRSVPGPNAKRYKPEINQIKRKNSSDDENNNGSQMTMSTLAAIDNGTNSSSNSTNTRPSTGGSTNRSGIIKGGNTGNNTPLRGNSAEDRRSTNLYSVINEHRETNFGEEVRVINGTLPPLRHTYKV
ncbi:hypothetical protein Mgra_00000303 [Meloidogyne graminicola]|uniref:Uncharacterized protein n=1 Tax=Meloidogyne graminicola TaxID=189291 RepID=A0A8T0A301_9BILA|nr:hypothetical protein Mgra_00000303 [Meloidogyne graminicola]